MNHQDTLYVTGANANYFPMLCVLQGAFQLYMPHLQLMVCDFGLTQGQARFLAAKNLLLSKPAHLEQNRHPFYYKGSMYQYMEHFKFDAMLWIDCDCLPVGPLDQAVLQVKQKKQLQGPGLMVTVDPNAMDLAFFLQKHGDTVTPFANRIAQHHLSTQKPYLNSGFFYVTDHAILKNYAEQTQNIAEHFLFEQNTFNTAAHISSSPIIFLEQKLWNLSGEDLNTVTCETSANALPVFHHAGQRVWNLHISDSKEQHFVELVQLNLLLEGGRFQGLLREPRREELRRLLHDILQYYLFNNKENIDLLKESGALE
ncbi:MAG: hypothetical protein HQL94_08910 [Magnetococcales bacterium]|nr:hypothetical protein [Magnetococcales bacterium]MBF0438855.1 hypothetical protein [Magnetococcales bacterium]